LGKYITGDVLLDHCRNRIRKRRTVPHDSTEQAVCRGAKLDPETRMNSSKWV
jgi:hypothetical protein